MSGAHVNPAVTVSLVAVGKFPWKKTFHYLGAQYAGAFLGACAVSVAYSDALKKVDPNKSAYSVGVYATYPKEWMSVEGAFFDQVINDHILFL